MYLIQEQIQSTWLMLAYDFSITRRILATGTLCCITSNGTSNHKENKTNGQVILNSTKSKHVLSLLCRTISNQEPGAGAWEFLLHQSYLMHTFCFSGVLPQKE